MTPGAKLHLLRRWLFAGLLLAGQALAAQSVLDVTQVHQEAVSLTGYFAVLEDPSATLTLADVSQPGFAERFQTGQATGQALGFGFTRSVIWLRLHVKNPSDQPVEHVLEIAYALLASVDFYQPAGSGYRSIEVGYLRPPSARALTSRFIALPVSLPAGADQQLYLRVQTPNSLNIPARLWTSEAFHARESSDYTLQALYFGIVLALGIYNLMLYLALREVNYLLYVLVIRALLDDIMPLLASNKFASIACFRQLQEALAGTELADEMAQTARLLQEFRFDRVQQRLRQLAQQQGWDPNPLGQALINSA